MGCKLRRALLAASGGTLCFSGVPPAMGDDVPGGVTLSAEVRPRFEVSDNRNLDPDPAGTTFLSETQLSFGILSETPLQRISADLDGVLRYGDVPEEQQFDPGFQDPRAAFSYTREQANSRFSADTVFSRTNLDFNEPLDPEELLQALEEASEEGEELDLDDLIDDSGTRQRFDVNLSLETGLTDPIGYDFDLGLSGRDYSDTDDPDLFDTRTQTYSATARLRLAPRTSGDLTFSQRDYSAEDEEETQRTTRTLSFGIDRDLSAITTLDTQLGIREIDETLEGLPGDPSTTDSAVIGSVSLTRQLPRGNIATTLESTFSDEGRRTRLDVSRALNLPRGGLALSIGASRGDDGETFAVANVDYSRELRRGQFTASLSRSVNSGGDDDDETLVTQAELAYDMQVNRLSGVSLNLDYAATEDVGGDTGDNSERGTFRAAYNRSLTAEWGLSAGYEYRFLNEEDEGDAESNTLFVSFDRSFRFAP